MNCPHCKATLREEAVFCDTCGEVVTNDADRTTLAFDSRADVNEDAYVGRVIGGKYKLLARLGSGGMGTVYRARRIHIGDDVAVKVLHSEYVNEPNTVERFRREAQAAAMLRHPSIVSIYDFGEARDNDPAFIIMELVDGQTLRQILETEGKLEPHRAVTLLIDVCKGVAVAHRLNIVHRDIKPDNIMILPPDVDDGQERVKVVDFGIAKLKDMVAAKTLTQSGRMIGTVYYMSPEQCAAEHLDARSDVYSLGAVLYELLSGHPPFTAETASGIIAKHLTQAPPPLPAELNVPAEVEAVIVKALAKEASARQADAAALRNELRLALGESPSRRTSENLGILTTKEQPVSVVQQSDIETRKVAPKPASADRPSRTRWLIPGLLALIVLAGLAIGPGRSLWKRWRENNPGKPVVTLKDWQVSHTLDTKSRVYALAFSPDDKTLVTASSEALRQDADFISELHFWNVGNGELQRSIVEHSEGMLAVAFSPDGRWLATGLGSGNASGKIGRVKLWDTQTGTLKWAVNGHSDFTTSVVFSPDGKTLASGSFDKTVKLWDVETGQLQKSLPQQGKVYAVAFAPAGGLIAVAGQNAVELRFVDSNDVKHALVTDGVAATAVTFSRDGKFVAASDVSGKVNVWEAETGAVKAVITEHTDLVDALAFSSDGNVLASGGYDTSVVLWDTQTNSMMIRLSDPDKVTSVAFSHNGLTLATGGWSKSVRLWSK
ncbi:MAG TPA: protein kinase [Pyrinomonadaceae bacterium]